jgi:signal transduction histidine kinase
VTAAARVALANVRLSAEVAARVREVEASRRRLVVAAAEQRRRLGAELERGAGRRLQRVAADMRRLAGERTGEVAGALAALADEVAAATGEVRLLAQGVHPPALTQRGLAAALAERAASSPLPVRLDVPATRLPAAHEATLFFACTEAVANATKHANATRVDVRMRTTGSDVRLTVTDDGVGGVDPRGGSGLRGLADRVDALGGRVDVDSVPAHGTCVSVKLPLA